MSDCSMCQWRNLYSTCTDGSREYAHYNHMRIVHNSLHPGEDHLFGDSVYAWEAGKGVKRCVLNQCHVAEGERD